MEETTVNREKIFREWMLCPKCEGKGYTASSQCTIHEYCDLCDGKRVITMAVWLTLTRMDEISWGK